MKTGEHILFENTPATYFTEAYPIGNGRLGGMVYGQCDRMRVGLNHDELWAGMRWDNTKDYDKKKFEELQSLALSGKYLEAHKLYESEFAKHDAGSYLTLGDLFIELPDGEVSSYRRELNLS